MNAVFLFLLNMIFFILVVAMGTGLGVGLLFMPCFIASLVLVITYAWQIPILMFISEKTGTVPTIILSLLLNVGVGIYCATEIYWYVPFSIATRLMCPILKVLPNGMPLAVGSPLENPSVVPIDIGITVALFVVCSHLTTGWFKNREAK